MFMGISHHPGHAFQFSDFLRRSLGIAPGYQNSALRVSPMDSPYELAHLRIGRGRDGTRIQDGHGALFQAGGFLKSRLEQLLFQGSAIGLACSTAKIENVKR